MFVFHFINEQPENLTIAYSVLIYFLFLLLFDPCGERAISGRLATAIPANAASRRQYSHRL
jgi:hypothetical protein